MNSEPIVMRGPDSVIRTLYASLLQNWNKRDAAAYAGLFAADGSIVGFDGSQVSGQAEIEAHLRAIFADHMTGTYVGKVRDVRLPAPDVALLRAVAGMIPSGQTDLAPALNAVQTLVAARLAGVWQILLFQSTPAQFHGRPDLVSELTDELRGLL